MTMKIGCLGPQDSYSCLAAKRLAPQTEIITFSNFPAVVNALKTGAADEIALPIENTIQGGVLQNMDLLAKEDDLFAVKEYILPVTHRLILQKGEDLSCVRRVYSHPQAIGQCSVFLSERLPQAKTVPCDSTAGSVACMRQAGDACIVGEHLAVKLKEYDVFPEPIADEKKNFTRFFLVRRGEKELQKPSRKIYFVATLPHRPGTLYALLGVIERHGINMTRIESRPIKDTPGEYRFFIEIEGDYSAQGTARLLEELRVSCRSFRLLGCY